MRDDIDYRMRIAPSQRRITFIGDSFTAAQGIADVGQRFANLVRAAKPGWDVQVFAGLGWNTGEEIAKLRSIIDAGYELDTVVLVYCWNDIRPLLSDPVPTPGTATNGPAERAKAAAARWKRANRHVRRFLMKHSYAINTILHRRRRQATAMGVDEILYPERIRQAYAGEPWKAQERLLVEFKSAVEKEASQLAAITFPWLASLESDRYPLGVMHHRVAELFSRIDVPHLDLLPVLSPSAGSGSLVINDLDSHPSAFAHRLAAEAIVPFLEGVVSSPPRTLQRPGGGMRP